MRSGFQPERLRVGAGRGGRQEQCVLMEVTRRGREGTQFSRAIHRELVLPIFYILETLKASYEVES